MSRCLSTLTDVDEEGFSAAALRRLSDRRAFPTRLDFSRDDIPEIRAETVDRMSISGIQDKLSLRLKRGKLNPVAEGGQYILKPIPSLRLPRLRDDVPPNEHLTMQLAEQCYGIDTAANACIRLSDDTWAYVTRRFDRGPDGRRIAQEDFCQLSGRTPKTAGEHYKYDGSYEEMGELLRRFCAAYRIESEKLFRRIVFNYAVANGDAHLKNFSLQQNERFGDYNLSPAYDLLCTKLHLPNEARLAIDLFKDGEMPTGVKTHGFVTGADFLELARRFELLDHRAEAIIHDLCHHRDEAHELVERSFLSKRAKTLYAEILDDRRRALEIR